MVSDWFGTNGHRLGCVLLLLSRITYKRDAAEAEDVKTLALLTLRASKARNRRSALLTALWCHVLFAEEGAKTVSQLLLQDAHWKFSVKNLLEIRKAIEAMEMKHQRKLSDLASTLTGTAWIDRILSHTKRLDLLRKCEEVINELSEMDIFAVPDQTFTEVHAVVKKLPLYGATRSVNFVRALSAGRLAFGMEQLEFDEEAWKTVLNMHENVLHAAQLQHILEYEQAEEACRLMSALVKLSYSSPASRARVRDLNPGDLALIFCEYSCILKELQTRGLVKTERSCCRWLLQRLPCELADIQKLRQQVVSHVKQDEDLATGWDGARARNVLGWWLDTEPSISAISTWPRAASRNFYCEHCAEVMPVCRCVDPRASFCDIDCWTALRRRKQGAGKRRRIQ